MSSASLASARGTSRLGESVAVSLPGAEVERLVAEEDVVRTTGRRQPGGGLVAGVDPGRGLAVVQRRRLVPAPGDLGGEERGEREHEDEPPAARDLEEPERDEACEEGEREDEMARLG